MKQRVFHTILGGIIIALMLTGCSSKVNTPPGAAVDTWQPPNGIDAVTASDFTSAGVIPVSCEENRSLYAYDAASPLDIQEEDRSQQDGLTVINLTYASPLGGRVPATLVIPDGSGPFAGLLYQHGMGGEFKLNVRKSMLPEPEAYARLGAVVILIDAPYYRKEHRGLNTLTLTEQDRREQIQYIVDLRRAVDLLLTYPEVDPQRLAYVGISGGAAVGGLFAGVEDRLRGYVFVVGDGGLVTHCTGPEDTEWWLKKPEGVRRQWLAWMWPIEPIHYVGCAAPAALLFQNGTLDQSVPPADAQRYQDAASEPKTIRWYKDPHNLGDQAFRDRAEWLKHTIGIASYRAAFPTNVKISLMAWYLLTAGSLVFLVWELWRRKPAPLGARLLWLLTTAFLGPLGLLIFWIAGPQAGEASAACAPKSPSRRALGSAAWAAAGNICGGIVVLALLCYVPRVFNNQPIRQIAIVIVLPLCVGWLIFAASRWLSRSDDAYLASFRRPVLAEIVSTYLVLTAVYPTVGVLSTRFFADWVGPYGIDLSYPPLWGVLSLATLAGALVTYPFHVWMIRRGVIQWGFAIGEDAVRKPAWYLQPALILLSLALMVTAILLSAKIA